MTGEISLRGDVLAIGGLPEKLMAAQRAGVKRVLIPAENKDDLQDVPNETRESLEIIPVMNLLEVLSMCGILGVERASDRVEHTDTWKEQTL